MRAVFSRADRRTCFVSGRKESEEYLREQYSFLLVHRELLTCTSRELLIMLENIARSVPSPRLKSGQGKRVEENVCGCRIA